MSDNTDLSQLFGESGATKFGDLPKRADVATAPSPPEVAVPKPEPVSNLPEKSLEFGPDDIDLDLADDLSDADVDDAFSVPAYVLPETIRSMARLRKARSNTNVDLVMDAIDYYVQRGQLGKLITRRQTGPGRPKNSIFPSRKTRSRGASDGKSRKLWTFQATPEERAVMEGLVEQHGAQSLSELVSVVVEARYKPKASQAGS